MNPAIKIDQARIGARYDELRAEARDRAAAGLLTFAEWRRTQMFWARRGGKPPLPAPWKETGPGVWTAPIGTPEPFAADCPPTAEEFANWMAAPRTPDWIAVDDLVGEMFPGDDSARRYFLNDVVQADPALVVGASSQWDPATASDPIEDMRSWIQKFKEADLPPPRRLEAGEVALSAIANSFHRSTPRGWPKTPESAAGALANLTGIPIVPNDEDLGPNGWRLVDARTGEVLYSGTIGPELGEYLL